VLDRKAGTIRAEYLDGPFKHLDNVWTFKAVDAGHSTVHFAIDYEFRSRTLSALMGTVFDKAFRKFADAFEKRADAVYGVAVLPPA
jgi:coenzyme Q-binding protein COQ10